MPVNEKILIIHHLEPIWQAGYLTNGTSFEHLCDRVCAHIKQEYYDKVILTHFADDALKAEEYVYSGLMGEIHETYEYGYGWEEDEVVELCSDQYCRGGYHSDYVLLPYWMQELSGSIDLCGCFLNECLEDMQIALRACGHKYRMLLDLTL